MADHPFANILLTGPCNLRCPDCIGRRIGSGIHESTLLRFPLPGLARWTSLVRESGIRQVSLTGVDTEPMLYRHQRALLCHLRSEVSAVQVSLHTNGTRILREPDLFNLYDRATISIPSFRPATYRAMTGASLPLDLEAIVRAAKIPLKVSVLVTSVNQSELPEILERCRGAGVRRVTLRRRHPASGPWNPLPMLRPVGQFGGNPVLDLDGLEVTLWDFARTTLQCLNLFPDGSINEEYLLEKRAHERHRALPNTG